MRIWWVAMLGLSGCLWAEVVPGRKMTRLPDGLQWCGPQPVSVDPSTGPARTDPFPRDYFKACTKLVSAEVDTDERWDGRLVFGITTDARGVVSDVCLWGGNFGDPVRYAACVADRVRGGPSLAPNQRKEPFVLHFFWD